MNRVGIWTWGPLPSSTRMIRPGFSVSTLSEMMASLAPWAWALRDLVVNVQSPREDSTILLIFLRALYSRGSKIQFSM